MNHRHTIKHMLRVSFSNLIALVSGAFIGFVLPKILTLDHFSYYHIFMLYAGYVSLCGLGIIEGIVLEYGGHDFQALHKETFRGFFLSFLIVQVIFAALLFIFGTIVFQNEYRTITWFLCIYLISTNVIHYFHHIDQITLNFHEYSLINILQSGVNVLIVAIMFVLYKINGGVDYKVFLWPLTIFNIGLAIWYTLHYRKISIGSIPPKNARRKNAVALLKTGLPLLVGNLCATIILALDQQVVNLFFDTTSFATYEFACGILSIVAIFTSAMATILYPTMKRKTEESLKKKFYLLLSTVLVLVFGSCFFFFPLKKIIVEFFPTYADSVSILQILFPEICISSAVTVIMHNYYKVWGHNTLYFKKSLVILCICPIISMTSYFLFHTIEAIACSSMITMTIWYLYIEMFFVKTIQYRPWKNRFFILILLVLFYLTSSSEYLIIHGFVYLGGFLLISYLFHHKELAEDFKNLFREKDENDSEFAEEEFNDPLHPLP